jgi:hypothetical protein
MKSIEFYESQFFRFSAILFTKTVCFSCSKKSSEGLILFAYVLLRIKVKVKVTLVEALRLCTGRTAHRGK